MGCIKYALLVIFLVLSAGVHSQDTLESRKPGGSSGNRGSAGQSYTGKNSIKDTLENRKLLYKGLVKDTCAETGRIVLAVVVDRKGNVVSAIIDRGSTSSSACLFEAAKAAAMQSKFEKNKNAAVLQPGKMFYYFRRQ